MNYFHPENSSSQKVCLTAQRISETQLHGGRYSAFKGKKKDFYRKPWTETFVNWNGDVFPYCCVHTEEKDRMGNIFEQDFEEIWNGENYVAARKEMLDQPNDLKTICHTCKKNGYDLS